MIQEQVLTENPGLVKTGYRRHPAIANSDLKYLYSPVMFRKNKENQLEKEDTAYFGYGRLLDDYLLSPSDKFDSKYILQKEMTTPNSPNKTKFIDYLLGEDGINNDILTEAYKANYKVSKKAVESGDVLIEAKKLFDELSDYYYFQIESQDKQPYSEDDLSLLKSSMIEARRNKQIDNLLFGETFDYVRLTHLKVVNVEKFGIKWKGEIDLVYIDKVDKIIYNVDVKTTASTIPGFKWKYKSYSYYRQQALYRELLKVILVEKGFIEDINEYQIMTRCIVFTKKHPVEAACIPIPEPVLQKGLEELEEAADLIKFYRENGWEYTKSYQKNDGLEIYDWDEVFD